MIQYITATNTNDMKHKTYAHITQVTITLVEADLDLLTLVPLSSYEDKMKLYP